ncbi:unnamed protein product [Trifolium pratense]|uniref:Uncharacterized protein n=1 Tax=Trifolium pratense TaxID=57577 RepID=A0ACB0KCC9_TRIPR|nr:unnamed protein product [Trifolium pratense]
MWCSPLLYLTNSKEGDGKEEDVTIGDDIDFMLEHVKKSVPEKDAAHDATASAAQENLENIVVPQSPDNVIIPDKGKYSDSNTAVISQSDESLNTLSVHDESAKKDNNADSNAIDVDNLTLTERTPAPSTRRLRCNAANQPDAGLRCCSIIVQHTEALFSCRIFISNLSEDLLQLYIQARASGQNEPCSASFIEVG